MLFKGDKGSIGPVTEGRGVCVLLQFTLLLLPPATKLGLGYIFTGMYDSVHRGGLPQCMMGYHPPGTEHAGRYGQRAGGTHPTGMQSCCLNSCERHTN